MAATIHIGIASSFGSPFSEIVVFGDSFEDTGNVFSTFQMPPSPPYFEGRFSNGPVWVERLASRLELPDLRPSELGGTNYAWGGATTGSIRGNLSDFVDDVDAQVEKYVSSKTPRGDELFVLAGGWNDLDQGQTNLQRIVQFLSSHVSVLASVGAKSFLVANVTRSAGDLAPQLNMLLSDELTRLREANNELTLHELDFASFFDAVNSDPVSYGFGDTSMPACADCGVGTTPNPVNIVPNPNEFFMWDDVHHTASFHQMLGDLAFELLAPQPPVLHGDFNADGTVDAGDYVVWRKGLGSTYSQEDYEVWRAHFAETGGSAPLPSAQALWAIIPEPSTEMLFAFGLFGLFIFPRINFDNGENQ
jgi:phospholipase/lecithinase/hemolysin